MIGTSSLISASDLSRAEILELLARATEMIPYAEAKGMPQKLSGKVLIQSTEMSTRTVHSTKVAAKYLGLDAEVIFLDKTNSSRGKGESPLDDAEQHAIQGMDVYVLRSHLEGEPRYIAEKLQELGYQIPVINAGDGENDHPTQMLLDLLTIQQLKGTIDGLTIGLAGDLRYGRVPHTLVRALRHFQVKVVTCAFGGLRLPRRLQEGLNIIDSAEDDLAPLRQCDVINTFRLQRERIADELAFREIERKRQITLEFLDSCDHKDVILMHPGPINAETSEIAPDVRRDPRVVISRVQAPMGLPVRMGVLARAMREFVPINAVGPEKIEYTSVERSANEAPHREDLYKAITCGTVIDHLPPSSSKLIDDLLLRMGEYTEGETVAPYRNVKHPDKPEKPPKDVILIRDGFISDIAAAIITMIAPEATINVLPGDGMQHKRTYKPPREIRTLFQCPNTKNCITHFDHEAATRFRMANDNVLCHYCERDFELASMLKNLNRR